MGPGASFLLLLLLLLLPRAAPGAGSDATSPGNSTGQDFIVFFPENIASYHPAPPQNQLWVTALFNRTNVTVRPFLNATGRQSVVMQMGETKTFHAFNVEDWEFRSPAEAFKVFNSTLRVSSDRPVVVQASSSRRRSAQAALVLPVDKLGLRYLLPPLPPGLQPGHTNTSTEGSPFRVILINGERPNTVRLTGASGTTAVLLGPGQAARLWLQDFRRVEAERPVAVLLGHPCAARSACSCGLLYAALPPAGNQTLSFPVPAALSRDAEGDTLLLLAGGGAGTGNGNGNWNGDGNGNRNGNGNGNRDGNDRVEAFRVEPFRPEAGGLKAAGAALLYRPGLLLPLIPESSFASCYLVHSLSDQLNLIVIVVHKDSKVGVHVGAKPLDSSSEDWEEVKGTEYESILLTASANTTAVWHNSSRMGVYYLGQKGSNLTLFGHPAASISSSPDFGGCLVTPEVLSVPEAGSWTRSIRACSNQSLDLVQFSSRAQHMQVCHALLARAGGPRRVWIGLRRSAATGEWYRLDDAPLNYTGWQGGGAAGGPCAVMSLNAKQDCGWREEDCCQDVQPLCYRPGTLLEVV